MENGEAGAGAIEIVMILLVLAPRAIGLIDFPGKRASARERRVSARSTVERWLPCYSLDTLLQKLFGLERLGRDPNLANRALEPVDLVESHADGGFSGGERCEFHFG